MNTHGSFKIGRGHTRPQRSWSGRSVVNMRPKRTVRQMSVDSNLLIRKATPSTQEEYTPINNFSDFGLFPQLTQNVTQKGYTAPTPIQDQVIPQVMAGHDVIGLAATGTGKTAAFLLPILHKLNAFPREKAIIITPTRELAVQIMEEGRSFAKSTRCYFSLIIGGVDMRRQIQELRRQPQIVVGTPGRINDLTNQGEIKLHEYKTIVLDEVDRMLDMGFIRDITKIVQSLPKERHSLFFSATMSEKVRSVAKSFLHSPITIQIASQKASDNVDQDVVRLGGRNKALVLKELLQQPGFDKVLVFGRTKHGMEKLSHYLYDLGFSTAAIHSNKSQNQRQRALNAFKNNQIQVLLATDVAARGIDVDNITHVINYELPETYDDYIHRIGRTGRAHKTGVALTFVD
jgi:superfamily II DNA/RNA helicase